MTSYNCIKMKHPSTGSYRTLESPERVASGVPVLEGGRAREVGRQVLQQQGPIYTQTTRVDFHLWQDSTEEAKRTG